MPRKGRLVRKQKAGVSAEQTEEEYAAAPHSFVIHRGKVGKYVQELTADFRKVNKKSQNTRGLDQIKILQIRELIF